MSGGDPTQTEAGTLVDEAPLGLEHAAPIAGRFQLRAWLGAGGMGVVYRAHDLVRDEAVALKLVRAGLGGGKLRERFDREIAALAAVAHPGVVRYLDHGTSSDGATYLVMELVEGEDLARRLARARLTAEEALVLARRLAESLAAAHQAGVVHRDLKPSNVLLPGGSLADAKLLDFGVARLSGATGLTRTGHVLGTPGYMSPEQARGEAGVDERTDIYSLGCVLFECLTGEPPFAGEHAMAVLAKILLDETPRIADRLGSVAPTTVIMPALDELVHSMMARDRERRPASARDLLGYVEQVHIGSFELARPPASASLSHSERRVLSVLFAGWSSGVDPTVVRAAATEASEVVELVDGSILVAFPRAGTPTDQAEQAARCALQIRERQRAAPLVLASGHGVVGRHTLLGEVIDRGAELMQRARGGEIRLDEPTAALLEPVALVDYDDDGARLQGLRVGDEPLRTLLGRPTPFVGRARELAALEAVIDESLTEPCANVALVLGEPGVGKSRLRYELLRRASVRQPEVEVLLGRADPLGSDAAYGLLGRALRGAAGIRPGEPPERQAERLHAYLFAGSTLAQARRERIAAFLAELVGVARAHGPDALESARVDPNFMREAIAEAWEEWLRDRCRTRAVLLTLEDLHWGDAGTIELVGRTLAALDELPLVVLAFARPELEQRFAALWADFDPHRIRLAPLARRAARKLAARVLGDATPATIDAMIERSGGNAFYLEELLRAAASGERAGLPDSVVGMVQARLAQLEPDARRLLRAGSVFGEVFWSGGVARLLGDAEPAVGKRLDALAAEELLTRRSQSTVLGSSELAFRHALVRDAAYATLTAEDRRIAHGLAGAWLEREAAAEPAVLARHFMLGEAFSDAVRWFERAAIAAIDAEDHERAGKLVEAGLECGAEAEALGRLRSIAARIAEESGEHEVAIVHAQAALSLLREGSQSWYATLAVLLESLGRTSRFDEIEAWLELAQGRPPEPDAIDACVRALAAGAMHASKGGRAATARAHAERARALIDGGTNNLLTRLRLLELEHELADMAGDLGRMLELTLELGEVIAAIDSPALRTRNAGGDGHLLAQLGANARAEAAFEFDRAYAARRGLRHRLFASLGMLAFLALRRGDIDGAGKRLAEAQASATGDWRFIGVLDGLGATLASIRGELDEALERARRSEHALRRARPLHPYGLAMLANVLRARGEIDEALAHAREAQAIVDELGSVSEIEVDVQVALLEALLAAGLREDAVRELVRFRARFDERVAGIPDAALRESFETGVPANARLLELSRELIPGE